MPSCFELAESIVDAVRIATVAEFARDRPGVRLPEVIAEVEIPAFAFIVRIEPPDASGWHCTFSVLQIGQELASFGKTKVVAWLVRDVLRRYREDVGAEESNA